MAIGQLNSSQTDFWTIFENFTGFSLKPAKFISKYFLLNTIDLTVVIIVMPEFQEVSRTFEAVRIVPIEKFPDENRPISIP